MAATGTEIPGPWRFRLWMLAGLIWLVAGFREPDKRGVYFMLAAAMAIFAFRHKPPGRL
jgi:hypothetical protein